jgi:hypothetical protein
MISIFKNKNNKKWTAYCIGNFNIDSDIVKHDDTSKNNKVYLSRNNYSSLIELDVETFFDDSSYYWECSIAECDWNNVYSIIHSNHSTSYDNDVMSVPNGE